MDIDAAYEAIAAGTARDPDLSWTRRRLQAMALSRAKEGTDEQRLGALRVAAVLGPRDGIPVVAELVKDPNAQVRAWAVHQAIGAKELGIGPLRAALDGPDPEHVRAALEHLSLWVDQGCVPALRRALGSADAGVRARAARLLGSVGGPSLRGDLERLGHDPDAAVRAAAQEALEILAGARPKAVRTPWWDDAASAGGDAPADPVAPPSSEPSPPSPSALYAAPAPEADAAPAAPSGLYAAAADPEPVAEAAPPQVPVVVRTGPPPEDPTAPPTWGADAKRWAAPAPEPAKAAAPSAAAPAPSWDGRPVPLPAVLPDETRALVKLLGMVDEADRAAVLPAFRQADAKRRRDEFSALLLGYAGTDPALGRGLCLLAGEIGGAAHVTGLRPLLRDPNVRVREAALRALGALAPPSAVPWMAPFLDDVAVRDAAVEALVAVGRRARADLVRDALQRVRTDDASFKARLAAAVGSLSS
jgi:HEAT repeat protein